MDILAKLFGSAARVKMMRLFLFNPEHFFTRREICERTEVPDKSVSRELLDLYDAGLVRKKSVIRERPKGNGHVEKSRAVAWGLNPKFLYLSSLKNLLIGTILLNRRSLVERLSRAGHLKLIIAAGIFKNDADSRVDLLIVGDRIKKGVLETTIKKIESEIGKDIRYAVFETPDFQYRLSISDRLVRDIVEYSHEKILDRLGLRP